jgi:hypothetical protein
MVTITNQKIIVKCDSERSGRNQLSLTLLEHFKGPRLNCQGLIRNQSVTKHFNHQIQ